MKKVVSVSLGSAARDHKVYTEICGQKVSIERVGTNGNVEQMIEIIKDLDGKVDAFGLGGMDLFLMANGKKYILKDAEKVIKHARKTPIVDGSGLKGTLEKQTLRYLNKNGFSFEDKKVLLVCALDRFGMAEELLDMGAKTIYGDLMFSLGIPVKITSLKTLSKIANVALPVVRHLPFKMLYPTGDKQELSSERYSEVFKWAEVIAGDFHFIKKHLPSNLKDKTIITNTVTSEDIELLRQRKLDTLVTTTPELNGRSFGTNVMEGVLVALDNRKNQNYSSLLKEVGFKPRVVRLSQHYKGYRGLSHG
ncbi:quinate 5-dehydrogenase [Proteinivorax hydrogeniformans]|uniref:Quinate 5-dehydrogenase n=1 Tax=Proteinivorax hydrogeniformans TaxID=1826727 RepID=A0AAU8HU08_9FIRM